MTIDNDLKALMKLLKYDRNTGIFTWKPRGSAAFDSVYAGKQAGTLHTSGRGRVSIAIKANYKKYYAHILAWAFVNKRWPTGDIDHKDHDTTNNRYRNLRDTSHAENKKNLPMTTRNKSGVVGVHWDSKRSRWVSKISVDKKTITLGTYKFKKEAVTARKEANVKYGFHFNHGKKKKESV